jgi:hypothetical protein
MTSGFRRLIARMLLAVFVFAQLATAAHACVSLGLDAAGVSAGQRATTVAPSIPPGRVEQLIAAVANADRGHCGARGCNDADSAFSNICDAHCQSEQQRVDASPSIKVAPAVLLTTGYRLHQWIEEPCNAASTGNGWLRPTWRTLHTRSCIAASDFDILSPDVGGLTSHPTVRRRVVVR